MFSGIIQAVVPIHAIHDIVNHKTYTIALPKHLMSNLKIGCSISNNGCCLTVIAIKYNLISFNLTYETLKKTNMRLLKIGDLINIEKPLTYHSEIGGHLMTGHIDCTGTIKKIINLKNNKIIWIHLQNKQLQKYILKQGSIGVDGISLTISRIIQSYIRLSLTTYTLNNTTLGIKKIGDIVNIEIDMIVKAIVHNSEQFLLHKNQTNRK